MGIQPLVRGESRTVVLASSSKRSNRIATRPHEDVERNNSLPGFYKFSQNIYKIQQNYFDM